MIIQMETIKNDLFTESRSLSNTFTKGALFCQLYLCFLKIADEKEIV